MRGRIHISGIDRRSKLILSYHIGKRTYPNTLAFVQDLKKRVAGKFQFTTDQWQGYVRPVLDTFYGGIDYAQQQKDFWLVKLHGASIFAGYVDWHKYHDPYRQPRP